MDALERVPGPLLRWSIEQAYAVRHDGVSTAPRRGRQDIQLCEDDDPRLAQAEAALAKATAAMERAKSAVVDAEASASECEKLAAQDCAQADCISAKARRVEAASGAAERAVRAGVDAIRVSVPTLQVKAVRQLLAAYAEAQDLPFERWNGLVGDSSGPSEIQAIAAQWVAIAFDAREKRLQAEQLKVNARSMYGAQAGRAVQEMESAADHAERLCWSHVSKRADGLIEDFISELRCLRCQAQIAERRAQDAADSAQGPDVLQRLLANLVESSATATLETVRFEGAGMQLTISPGGCFELVQSSRGQRMDVASHGLNSYLDPLNTLGNKVTRGSISLSGNHQLTLTPRATLEPGEGRIASGQHLDNEAGTSEYAREDEGDDAATDGEGCDEKCLECELLPGWRLQLLDVELELLRD